MNIYNFISFLGIFALMFIAWIFSKDRRNINWRVVFWGVSLQLLFACFIFYVPLGLFLFNWINKAVIKLLSFANAGIYFVFGPLAIPPGSVGPQGENSLGFILAFQALPLVVFFSSLMALLYHIGLMQKVVKLFAWVFTRLMRISGAESLCTSFNIVVGIESVFSIRPYIEEMTLSELCMLLTAGMSTIASTVMAVYAGFLYKDFPTIAGHLVSASILSAPAAIVMAKLLYPEDKKPQTLGKVVEPEYQKAGSWVEAIIKGSQEGVRMAVGIVALLLAFLGLLAMLNWFIYFLGKRIGLIFGTSLQLSLERLLSYLYYPFCFLIGVPFSDIPAVAMLLGERTILTELVAYQHLAKLISTAGLIDFRSAVISAYALCGFAHIASLAIFVGGISGIAPKRTADLGRLGLRALLASTLACLMTSAVAGLFFTPNTKVIIGF
ncbi:MAG: nucleoside transporter [Candidatus Omnitrophica bacterium]|nr:nucleoside transporter [Candidatus Omnitrophota bacterium]